MTSVTYRLVKCTHLNISQLATFFFCRTMLSILAAIDAAFTRVIPQHSIPFYELAPLLLPPSPTYLVHVETLAGLRTTLTNPSN